MALVKWRKREIGDPISEFERLQDEINKLFQFGRFPDATGLFDRTVSPALDVVESAEGYTVICDLPGVDPKDIDVNILDNVLTIKGEKKESSESRDAKVYKKETWSGSFQRTLSLPSSLDGSKVEAELKNGILRILLPKREEAKPKQITVNLKE